MHIVITGGSGFLGSALTRALAGDGHDVTVLTRQTTPPPARQRVTHQPWNPNGQSAAWAAAINGADAVVNLSGESIAAKRWSTGQKQTLRDSRLMATRSVIAAIREATQPPAVLVSGSAVGYYGDRGDEILTEQSAPGSDFLAVLAQEWEAAATAVASITRVALIRTGVVLDRRGGALQKMLPPFLMFLFFIGIWYLYSSLKYDITAQRINGLPYPHEVISKGFMLNNPRARPTA